MINGSLIGMEIYNNLVVCSIDLNRNLLIVNYVRSFWTTLKQQGSFFKISLE